MVRQYARIMLIYNLLHFSNTFELKQTETFEVFILGEMVQV